MREHPIIFSAPMVRAILAGRKSVTRRVVKPKYDPANWDWDPKDKNYGPWVQDEYGDHYKATDYAPWQPGDRLWVRETWFETNKDYGGVISSAYVYRATYEANRNEHFGTQKPDKWIPSIFMPRAASRITLEVTSVRVERVQDITEDDAISEGVLTLSYTPEYQKAFDEAVAAGQKPPLGESPRQRFARLWDSINAKKGYGWESNCWVWVIEFRRVDA